MVPALVHLHVGIPEPPLTMTDIGAAQATPLSGERRKRLHPWLTQGGEHRFGRHERSDGHEQRQSVREELPSGDMCDPQATGREQQRGIPDAAASHCLVADQQAQQDS